MTDSSGRWIVSNLTAGPVEVATSVPGFKRFVQKFHYDAARPVPVGSALQVAAATENVEVTATL